MVPLHYRQRQWFQWFNANGVQKTEVFCTAQFGCTSTVRFLYTKTALLQRSLQAGTFNQPDSVCRQCLQGISFGRASLAYRFGVQKTEVFPTPVSLEPACATCVIATSFLYIPTDSQSGTWQRDIRNLVFSERSSPPHRYGSTYVDASGVKGFCGRRFLVALDRHRFLS